jgi:hypothetical protein
MLVYRRVKRSVAIVLVGAGVVAGGAVGGQALAEGSQPSAMPPILQAATPSELAQLEWSGAEGFSYGDPPSRPYSDVEMNAFASEGYVGR